MRDDASTTPSCFDQDSQTRGSRVTIANMSARLLIPLALVLAAGCGKRPEDPKPCEDSDVRLLTTGSGLDEDGSFVLGTDGNVHFAWISNDGPGTPFGTKVISTTNEAEWDGISWTIPVNAVPNAGQENLLNNITQTADGTYHLTGRYGRFGNGTTGHVSSTDLVNWSPVDEWTDETLFNFSPGVLVEHPGTGDFYLLFLTNDGGNFDLYLQRSTDRGTTWTGPSGEVDGDNRPDPLLLTNSPMHDFIFNMKITDAGEFILVWERFDPADPGSYFGRSSEIFYMTSTDGASWAPEQNLTNDPAGAGQMDALPWLHEYQGNLYLTWLTTRVPSLEGFSVVMAPLTPTPDLTTLQRVPARGYSVRSQRLADGRYILAWVRDMDPDPAPKALNYDYEYRIVCDLEFPPAE